MHVHLGIVHAATIFASVLVFGFFWRLASMYWSDTPAGQAMAFIY